MHRKTATNGSGKKSTFIPSSRPKRGDDELPSLRRTNEKRVVFRRVAAAMSKLERGIDCKTELVNQIYHNAVKAFLVFPNERFRLLFLCTWGPPWQGGAPHRASPRLFRVAPTFTTATETTDDATPVAAPTINRGASWWSRGSLHPPPRPRSHITVPFLAQLTRQFPQHTNQFPLPRS